ncbi:hypothetical protein SAMN05216232_0132 [Virgibacillus subterraneus]|uniref:Uncharacterized protein n=1 Tax=Virgibacillus subterraneus TaxID=621109 RepID=A0A1H9L475_9BACI|nr:hypothetical protein [Virgibacillus subterraneus]SER06244.1 hypothetical protein SAMN05216232_0132 [Virgibacillus subterraneus]
MEYNNAITVTATILVWLVIIIIIYTKYKKLQEKPKLWKIILIVLIGMFSFSINTNFLDTVVRIPILPLGVWILIFAFRDKKEKWEVYRTFAWLGFFFLFIFILSKLIIIPVNQAIYPKEELSTYIANLDNASLIQTHPSVEERSLNKDHLADEIARMRHETIHSEQWYQKVTSNVETENIEERFPYQLTGSLPKRGSGVDAIIYVEKDGKGLLITAAKGQYYFRSDDSLLEEGGND